MTVAAGVAGREVARRETPPSRQRALVVTLLITATIAACGLRTPVRPPEDTAPIIPGIATVTREDDAIVVQWKRAERSADGMKLDDLVAFVVERRRDGEDAWQAVGTVDVVDQDKIRRRQNFSWRDTETAGDAEYRVFAVTSDGQHGPPREATVAADEEEPAVDDVIDPTAEPAAVEQPAETSSPAQPSDSPAPASTTPATTAPVSR